MTRGRGTTSVHRLNHAARGEQRAIDQYRRTRLDQGAGADAGASSFHTGHVPAPKAHDDWESSQGFLGQVGERIRMFFGMHKPFMESTYASEGRHSDWAGAMEAVLRQRFSRTVLDGAGLGEMSLDSVDCRTSICRVDVEYPADLAATFPSRENRREVGFDGRTLVFGADGPVERLLLQSGPLASTTGIVPGRRPKEAGRGTPGLILIFSGEEIDPNEYLPWVRGIRANPPTPSPANPPWQTDGASPRR